MAPRVRSRCRAVVDPPAVPAPAARGVDRKDLRKCRRHPSRLRRSGCGQHDSDPLSGDGVDDALEPAELERVLGRLEQRPGEDAQRDGVDAEALERVEVGDADRLGPLFRVVVAPNQSDDGPPTILTASPKEAHRSNSCQRWQCVRPEPLTVDKVRSSHESKRYEQRRSPASTRRSDRPPGPHVA